MLLESCQIEITYPFQNRCWESDRFPITVLLMFHIQLFDFFFYASTEELDYKKSDVLQCQNMISHLNQ